MASGPALYVVRVEHRVSSLQLLCQQAIASALREDKDVSKLTLPPRLCSYLSTAFIPTIKVEPSPSSARVGAGQTGKGGEGPGAAPQSSTTVSPTVCEGVPSRDGRQLSHSKGGVPSLVLCRRDDQSASFNPDFLADAIIPTCGSQNRVPGS